MSRAEDLAVRWTRALTTHDLEAAAGCFHPDYRDVAPARRGETVNGRAEARRNLSRLFEDVPDLRAALLSSVGDDETVWMEWRIWGTRRDGTSMDFVGVNIFRVKDDQFVSGRIYTELARDAGGIEAQIEAMATGHSREELVRAKAMRPTAADRAPYMLGPDAGEGHWVRGNQFTFKASGREVGDGFAVVETLLHPLAAAPAHLHVATDEALYVLEGDIGVEVGGQRFEASPGCFAFLPKGVPHRYIPRDPGPVRVLWLLSPSGFEDFWRETGTPIVEGEPPPPPAPPDPERMSDLGSKYGTKFLP